MYAGEHKAIIDEELWTAVQARLADNRRTRRKSRVETGALLGGLIYDDRRFSAPSGPVRKPTAPFSTPLLFAARTILKRLIPVKVIRIMIC